MIDFCRKRHEILQPEIHSSIEASETQEPYKE